MLAEEAVMPYVRRRSCGNVALLVLVFAGAAVGHAQPGNPAPDLKSIAGKWMGTGQSSLGTNPLEWTVKEDGTVAVVAGTPSGPRAGVAKISIRDGKFFYDSASSSGPVTLHEEGGRRTLKYEAMFKRDNSRGGAELTPAK
jgi:hypothetical protein